MAQYFQHKLLGQSYDYDAYSHKVQATCYTCCRSHQDPKSIVTSEIIFCWPKISQFNCTVHISLFINGLLLSCLLYFSKRTTANSTGIAEGIPKKLPISLHSTCMINMSFLFIQKVRNRSKYKSDCFNTSHHLTWISEWKLKLEYCRSLQQVWHIVPCRVAVRSEITAHMSHCLQGIHIPQ